MVFPSSILAPLSGQWDRRGETQTDVWARRNARFCRLVLLEGLDGVDTVYAFNGAALEIFKAAKRLGLRTILDQTAAPWRWNSALLQAERDRWPGWEDQPAEMDHSGLLTLREEEEWGRADRIICGSDFSREALLETAGSPPRPLATHQSQPQREIQLQGCFPIGKVERDLVQKPRLRHPPREKMRQT